MVDTGQKGTVREKFLIIDDNPVFIDLFNEVVCINFDVDVLYAKDGEEALKKASREKPSLIVLDLLLSCHGIPDYLIKLIKKGEFYEDILDVDMVYLLGAGFRIALMLKGTEETNAIPILGMSTLDIGFIRSTAKLAGCDGFITKPFAIKDFISAIKNLKQKRSG